MPFNQLLRDVVLGSPVGPEPAYGDDADGWVRLAVTSSVEPVPIGHAGRQDTGATPHSIANTAQHRERRLRLQPFRAAPTVTISCVADRAPTQLHLINSGAHSSSSALIMPSSSSIPSSRSR